MTKEIDDNLQKGKKTDKNYKNVTKDFSYVLLYIVSLFDFCTDYTNNNVLLPKEITRWVRPYQQ